MGGISWTESILVSFQNTTFQAFNLKFLRQLRDLSATEIKISRPILSRKEPKALNSLKLNKNFKRPEKGTTIVVMDKNDKIREGPVQTNDLNNYKREVNNPVPNVLGSILIAEIFST